MQPDTDLISQWKSEITQQELIIMKIRCNAQTSVVTNKIHDVSDTEIMSKELNDIMKKMPVTDISPTFSSIHEEQFCTVTTDDIIKQIALEFQLNHAQNMAFTIISQQNIYINFMLMMILYEC